MHQSRHLIDQATSPGFLCVCVFFFFNFQGLKLTSTSLKSDIKRSVYILQEEKFALLVTTHPH